MREKTKSQNKNATKVFTCKKKTLRGKTKTSDARIFPVSSGVLWKNTYFSKIEMGHTSFYILLIDIAGPTTLFLCI